MAEPSKDELRKEIAVILKDANLEETAAKKVRLQLEANLNCDLSTRKKEVDDLVMEYVNAQDESGEEEEEEDDEEEEEEEKPVKKVEKKPAGRPKKKKSEDEDEDDDDSDDNAGKKKGKRGAPAKRGPAKKKKRGSDSDEDSDGSGESDDDYKPNKVPKGAAKKGPTTGRKSTGFTRPYTLSPELAAICGADSLPRHEVVKKVWAIIKERNLYDPKNKQFAICDSELQKVIGVKRFRTFGMLKYLKPHFLN
ncbi:uncharacterized protein LOC128742976 [Sabethes cyaneus]|uniref:uncharacterized protein LOC128742976 n=1 Tax=Sabethes cyaneus TaxID=53552 RepID=UPI00221E3380|nr:uncharacterized protein LOC128742976 [Sabethes cyaneus]